jgi:ubiquinone/menaquinone biosynthesis C-methylase UbiE
MSNTSTRSAEAYVLGHADAELQRLAEQAAFYADLTEDAFRRAGLAPGMRVLDVGCGAGDVSLLAATLVGSTGEVLGIDRSPDAVATARRRADAAGIAHARFQVSEIDVAPAAPAPGFDAVIGRLVLLYQSDPAAVLRGLAQLARPGGVLVFQEFDMRAARSTPVVPTYRWCCDRIIALYERAGLEPDMGTKLFGAFQGAGLPAPTMIGACRVEGGPDSYVYRYIAATMRSLLPMFERVGVATAMEVDADMLEARMRAEAVEGACTLVLPMFVAAWARTAA